MIKFEHSIFALPFAIIGMMWGSKSATGSPWPGWWVVFWIVAAMVTCRSAAMAFNRIADRDIDAQNDRTKMRAIPAGLISLRSASIFFLASCALFFLSAGMLNSLALMLSPIALGVTLLYSMTKRFTWLCHYVLGLSLGIAPAAAWIAATGRLDAAILPMVGAVLFWTAGFDIIYALQDDEFDKQSGLQSIPSRFGRSKALLISRVSHTLAAVLLLASCLLTGSGIWAYAGVSVAAGVLAYEQSLVKPNDLSRVNMAFFTLNGIVGLALLGFFLLDQVF